MDLVKMHVDRDLQYSFNIYFLIQKWSAPALKGFTQFFL